MAAHAASCYIESQVLHMVLMLAASMRDPINMYMAGSNGQKHCKLASIHHTEVHGQRSSVAETITYFTG